MKRAIVAAASLAVLLLVLMAPALWWGSDGETTTDYDFDITTYTADFTVADNGDLAVDETLVVNFFGSANHGIFRFWDRVDENAPHARRTPERITVKRDGEPEPFELQDQDGNRFKVAKVGSADETLTSGEHVYEIHYEIDGVLERGTDGRRTQLYWDLVPDGPSIGSTDLTIHLPAASDRVECAVGSGATGGCTATGEGTETLRIATGPLEAHTPVTVKTGIDVPTPEPGETRPWTARFDQVLGPHPAVLALVALLGVGAAVAGAAAARRTYESNPQFPLMYAPPEGIGPAQATYVLHESIDRSAYVATLMHAAEKGAVDLQKTGDAWRISDKAGPQGWTGLDPVTTRVAHLLGGPGTSFLAAPKDVEAGKRLKSEIESFEEHTKEWATGSGHLVTTGLGGWGRLLVLAGFAGAIAIVIWNPLGMTMTGLVPGMFAIFGAPLLRTGASTKRTRQGRELWSRIGGFKRVLSTPSSQDRFDFSGREDLYTAYIPWAVAFGCADEWAAKYRTEMAQEPPAPSYLAAGYAGSTVGTSVDSMVSDFDSTVSSAISAYQATQSSSSSSGGGGGFSGGGGGGGGGVGSW
jgi:uncharacterized membrane protein YgcG